MQLDADEDGEPFFKPQQVGPPTTTAGKQKEAKSESENAAKSQSKPEDAGGTEADQSEHPPEPAGQED